MASGGGIVVKDVVKYGLRYIFKIIPERLLPKYLCTSHISKNSGGQVKAIHLQAKFRSLTPTEYSTL